MTTKRPSNYEYFAIIYDALETNFKEGNLDTADLYTGILLGLGMVMYHGYDAADIWNRVEVLVDERNYESILAEFKPLRLMYH